MRPPRIPNALPWEQETVYFLTLSVHFRKPVLDNALAWQSCRAAFHRLNEWSVLCAIAMPDHLHLLAAPQKSRNASVGQFARWFKRWFYADAKPNWRWEEGVFDRLLRSDESRAEKWEYMRENPVRAGLVGTADDWPYQFGLSVG
jgi:REP element-mobilizing transposase RayT